MSDDQIAILGCGIALLACMVVMTLSAQVGKFVRQDDADLEPESIRVEPAKERRRAA